MIQKLNIIIFSAMSFIVILFLTATYLDAQYEKKIFNNQIMSLEEITKDEYKKRLKESVNHTIGVIDTLYKRHIKIQEIILKKKSNKLNAKFEKEFLNDARNYLYHNIFDRARYTWINKIINFEGGNNYAIRLIHPNLKKTEGKLLSTNAEDIKGNRPYLEELEGVKKNKEIYFTYYFKQLNSKEITEKLSYSKLYEKLNWVIATGIPLNSLNEALLNKKEALKKEYNEHLVDMYLFRGISLLFFIITLLLLRKKLIKTLTENENLNKQLKKKLESAQTNLNKFFELPINLLIVANTKGTILQINSGWDKILGYKEHELVNTSFMDLVHPSDVQKTLNEVSRLSDGENTFYFENRYRHKDGSYKTLAWAANSIPQSELIYAAAHDITELKDKSNLIYQQSKMAAIGEMTANIAHQWRQPLSIISTASSGILLKKMADDLDDEFLIDTLNQITKSTQYLSNTIEDFRNFYSPNKDVSSFTIDSLITKTLDLLRKRFENENITIIKNIEETNITNFENELLQVIINLLNNARDQLLKIDSNKKLILINSYKKDDVIYIDIIDNGKGIDEKIINRVFEPYFTTKEKSVGTGIGLYMSEEIVAKHLKGDIFVENHNFTYEGEDYLGAKFTIKLYHDKQK